MAVNVNVSVEELRNFSQYISDFGKHIDSDCNELESSCRKLEASMDEESSADISNITNQISRIIVDAAPTLNTLKNKVEQYADFVERLKQAARK